MKLFDNYLKSGFQNYFNATKRLCIVINHNLDVGIIHFKFQSVSTSISGGRKIMRLKSKKSKKSKKSRTLKKRKNKYTRKYTRKY